MGKYEAVYADIHSILATSEWLAESIKTIPDNYSGTGLGDTYIRVSVVTPSFDPLGPRASVNGQLIIDIFIPAGNGNKAAIQIADKLDVYLASKTIQIPPNGNTQFGRSSLTFLGVDRANPSLYRASYSISFNHFGK